MGHLFRLLLLAGFVALGAGLALRRTADERRRRETAFIAFVLGVSLAVGVSQKDAWPFSPHPVLAEDATASYDLERVELKGIDASGREWDVHPWAWSPLPAKKIADWVRLVYPRLSADEKRRAAQFLLARAEEARREAWAGRSIGNRRVLGALAAPDWLRHRDAATSPQPFVALRAYRLRWRPRELLADPSRVSRTLVFDTSGS
jgi:hypothetical protein